MVNPLRGEAHLVAGDNAYTLVFDVNAICNAEEACSTPGKDAAIDQILERWTMGPPVHLVRELLWAMLQKHHPCSMEEAGDIMADAGGPAIVRPVIEKAMLIAMPAPEDDEGNVDGAGQKKARSKKAGTG